MLYVTRRLDATGPILRLLCGAILATAIAGCANTPKTKGFPWWPQGPGNTSGDVLRTANAEPSDVAHGPPSPEGNSAPDRRPPTQKPLNAAEPSQTATHADTAHPSSTQLTNSDSHSEAQAVRYGDLLFVSGQIADDPASLTIVGSDIQAQVRTAMDNVMRILESHGLSSSNILSVTMYLQDINELPKADAVYASYFRRSLPARSVVRVDGLRKGSLVEISVIAGK